MVHSRKQMHHTASDDTEEVVVPGVTALIGILLTGLLYLVLPANLTVGTNWLVLVPLAVSTLALVVGVALFVLTVPTNTHATNLLRAGALLWSFNILVFALWYWEIDGGGPWKRHLAGHRAADFLFPQQASGEHWTPHFLDYLFVAFTGATALSPADTYPLTRLAKMLMMCEALLSLTIAAILIARAVNILGG